MDSNFDLNLPYIANENEFLFDLNQTPTVEEIDTLDNEEEEEEDDDDDNDALVNSHVYASDLFTETDQGNCGRKKIPLNLNQVKSIPFHKRTSLRSLSKSLGIATSTLHKRVKEGMLRHHTNAIKPSLKDGNIRDRLKFCFSMLEKDSLIHEPKFVNMYNIVHIDEKWFYMTKKMEKYYLVPDEEVPHRTCQSKNYIEKVMFLAAMARPRFDEEGNETFSGKIGVFPFVSMQPAKRRSKNRDAGTLELKASTSVKREDIRACLIEKVIPVIHERWPVEDRGKTIFIQQDNARTHVQCGDKEFKEAA
ncbi:uncharacterized protein LOC106362896 [Brassica napus]|uniref:uncharacterized protein LOC106362896 n=1 Tax=Brassica napus TaxID=3708 RepID=UPI0006AAAC09|nr:uncharacterized protein LOC106362896 [Brassica napus]